MDDPQSAEPGELWEARFESVSRLDDPDEDETYEVQFEMLGPATNGVIHVSIDDVDEALIIGEGSARLEEALRAWLRAVERRNGTGPIEPKSG